jgi:transketolase
MNYSQNLHFLKAGLEQLKEYLLSTEIFWNASLPANYPQFTLGNLLLAAAELQAASESMAAESNQWRELLAELAKQKKEWRTNWERKAQKEFGARLRQWVQYVDEMVQNSSRPPAHYKTDVRVRALLELLAAEAPALWGQLASPDARLKRIVGDGDFIWEEDVKGAFPKNKYWFLWVKQKT